MKYLLLIFILSFFYSAIFADSLFVKGADGNFLPDVAAGFQEKDGGVLISFKKTVQIKDVKKRINSAFPELRVEILGNNIFFSNITSETFLTMVSDVDLGLNYQKEFLFKIKGSKKEIALEKNRVGKSNKLLSDNYAIQGVVARNDILKDDGLVKLRVKITKPAKKGRYRKVKGVVQLNLFFEMINKKVDVLNVSNLKKSDGLIASKGQKVVFKVSERSQSGSFVVTELELVD